MKKIRFLQSVAYPLHKTTYNINDEIEVEDSLANIFKEQGIADILIEEKKTVKPATKTKRAQKSTEE